MFRRVLFAPCLVALLTCLAGFALAQQAGQIVGSISDAKGEAIPGAAVKATEVGTGFARTRVADSDGRFVLPGLRPAQYEIAVEAKGFRPILRTGIELLANNFNNPNTSVTGGGFGAITSTNPYGGDPRIIQFGLKLTF